jgi:hypothetical protein
MASRLYFARAGDFLVSTDAESLGFIRKLGDGEETVFKPLRPRSLQWHRKYWGMLSDIAPHLTEINISLGDTPAMMPVNSAEDLHVAIKLITGHCLTQHIKGTPYVLRIPKPTDFSSMTADEWGPFYERALQAIHERALPQVDIPEMQEELARMAS